MDTEIKDAIKQRILGLIRKPQQEVKKKKPMNMAPLALVGFNGIMFFLDVISGVTVGLLINPFYGVLTFLAGFLALLLHEKLFTNAHANMSQKWIAVGGGVLAVVSTFGIGSLSAVANVFNLTKIVSTTTIEIAMAVGLVGIAFVHGILWGVYYFTDPTHIAEMKRLVNMAYREQQVQGLADAKEDLAQVKTISKELEEYERRGELDLLSASYESLRGRALITDELPVEQSVQADPKMPFLAKQQVIPPLPKLSDDGS